MRPKVSKKDKVGRSGQRPALRLSPNPAWEVWAAYPSMGRWEVRKRSSPVRE